MGLVFNWHIYCPLSSSFTLVICKLKVVVKSPVTLIRLLKVITVSCNVWIAFVSDFTHPTWKLICLNTPSFFHYAFGFSFSPKCSIRFLEDTFLYQKYILLYTNVCKLLFDVNWTYIQKKRTLHNRLWSAHCPLMWNKVILHYIYKKYWHI